MHLRAPRRGSGGASHRLSDFFLSCFRFSAALESVRTSGLYPFLPRAGFHCADGIPSVVMMMLSAYWLSVPAAMGTREKAS